MIGRVADQRACVIVLAGLVEEEGSGASGRQSKAKSDQRLARTARALLLAVAASTPRAVAGGSVTILDRLHIVCWAHAVRLTWAIPGRSLHLALVALAAVALILDGVDGKVAGIVSERDLLRAIGQGGPEVLKEPVSDFMTKTVITAREADTINQLLSEMTTRRFRHMPVVERGRLIGLISIGDLVKIQISAMEMEAAATREYTA